VEGMTKLVSVSINYFGSFRFFHYSTFVQQSNTCFTKKMETERNNEKIQTMEMRLRMTVSAVCIITVTNVIALLITFITACVY